MTVAVRDTFLALALALPAAGLAAGPIRGEPVWRGTCSVCHANPDADAPQVNDPAAWRARLAKGAPALYRSALGGFKGPAGTEMPPRGGNQSLTDDEVRAAVDYMMRAASSNPERKMP